MVYSHLPYPWYAPKTKIRDVLFFSAAKGGRGNLSYEIFQNSKVPGRNLEEFRVNEGSINVDISQTTSVCSLFTGRMKLTDAAANVWNWIMKYATLPVEISFGYSGEKYEHFTKLNTYIELFLYLISQI